MLKHRPTSANLEFTLEDLLHEVYISISHLVCNGEDLPGGWTILIAINLDIIIDLSFHMSKEQCFAQENIR